MMKPSPDKAQQGWRRWCAAGLAMSMAAMAPLAGAAAPHVPTNDAEIVERLPTTTDATTRQIRRMRQDLAQDPTNLELAVRLARRYIQIGRAESDPRYNGYAQAALQNWWNEATPPVEVLVLRATLRQNRHDFDDALKDLSTALTIDPRNAQAWLTQAVILQVQGRLEAAHAACARLVPLAVPLVTATCLADVASVSGDAQQGYDMLSRALAAPATVDASPRLWSLTVLAEIAARIGDADEAERHFRAALALDTRDAYLLGAYADFLLDHGRAAETRDLLAGETRADPLFLRLVLAEKAIGVSDLRDHVAILSARFEASRMRGDTVHRREEARFLLHLANRPVEALSRAQENWQVQREPWDARLVLEAALAAGNPAAAGDVIAWLEATGLEDPQIDALRNRLAEVDQ
jgi:tetratricopeptide (TPR) repeat protein